MRELHELAAQLVAIDSVNPDLVPGAAGEGEIARFVANWLERAGLEVTLEEAAPGRPNVIGVARGSGGGRSLILNAHVDTVGVAGMEQPHTPRIEGNRLYGRGSFDMKGSLAAIMFAAAEARRRSLRGDVIVTAVVDEEYASIGTQALLKSHRADAAIVTESTALHICIAHKGFLWLEIETGGFAAHGSLPELGVDAIAKMGPVLVELERLDRTLRAGQGHPLLGTGSLHASLISGGQELSSYPERCLLSIERRTIPGETRTQVEREMQQLLARAAADPAFHATWRTTLVREPFEIAREEPIVQIVREQATRAASSEPEYVGSSGWMDAALLAAAGIPTVIFGPDGEGAHAVVEWVDLEQVERCFHTLVGAIEAFCG